ncbi:MAG: two pore domain potassium channel family protein [Rhodobacterales bacterium]|nr:two pore domain potassium channel family protein [Rhodobacterales bacterium]
MVVQIALGSALMLVTILIGAVSALALEIGFLRGQPWLMREPQRLKLLLVVTVISIWVLGVVTLGVWMWTALFLTLGLFPTVEEAVYFALVVYTTLGLGDVLAPPDWRILSAMAAANGFLTFGLQTALLVEALRHVRLRQVEYRGR